jgi:hypothetical protein
MPQKLTPEVKKHLRELALAIQPAGPTIPAPPQMLTAEQMTQRLGITHDVEGKPLLAGELYLAKDAPRVNHLRRLETQYYHGGMAAVERYLQPYKKPEALLRAAA